MGRSPFVFDNLMNLSTALADPTALDLAAEELADAATLELALERMDLERSFHSFVVAAWPLVEPGVEFADNWHVRALCKVLQDCYYRKRRRLIVNVPPGTMKSLLVLTLFPAWAWAKNPRLRFLTASYGQHLSTRDSVKTRQILESPWFQERWPLKLADDQNAKTRYNTHERGWRIATSVDGVGTGEHPDFFIIDDPTSATEADSETVRESANRWFDNTVSTRLGRNPVIIVVMQRLHQTDLSGYLLKRGGWDHVRWPMRFEKCSCPTDTNGPLASDQLCPLHRADKDFTPDPLDERAEPGQLLWPSLFPESKVKELETNLGAYGAAGQLQQRPAPEGGGQFKREWFKLADAAPALMRVARGWDTAASEGKGDWTVGAKVGEEFENVLIPAEGTTRARRDVRSTGRFFVLDVIRTQSGPAGVDVLIKQTAELDGKDCAQREEKEGGSAGKTVVDARAKTLVGFNYAGVQISGSKPTRLKPFRAQCEAGNVYLVKAAWNEEYLREMALFPNGDHDDQADATGAAFNAVLLEEPPRKISPFWGSR